MKTRPWPLGRLHWVQQNYLRAETLVRANARLVDHQATLVLAGEMGGGEVASADGLRFVTPVRTLNSGTEPQVFRLGPRHHLLQLHLRSIHRLPWHRRARHAARSIYILEGLLEQKTSLNPTEIMADAGEARFYRMDPNADYGALGDIARHSVGVKRIRQHWDDMLRVAGS